MSSPVPVRQRFRPGIDEIPDDVLEQIAHAGDCAIDSGYLHPGTKEGLTFARLAIRNRPNPGAWEWEAWSGAARWAARLLGVEVRP